MITHLFFDLDHTLWDFETNKNEVLRLLWLEFFSGKEALFEDFQEAFDRHNETLWAGFRNGSVSREDLRWKRFSRALLELRLPVPEKQVHMLSARFLELLPQQTALLPFTHELLTFCRQQGYPMAIITNGFDATQRLKLRAAKIEGFFTDIFSSEGCGVPKPHEAIFRMAQQECGAASGSVCLMIGDSLEADILGARLAGWQSVFYNPIRRVHAAAPTYEIACLSELPGLLA
ncbi:MAG: noncanonical pyrimidine nucleotidase, YjjG family [Sphingobacteriales bacterium]|nr:MAG: noncanonical pyrimidine nucleotidase, YjjG family [Sphingobacteriales bacterium]